MEDKLVTKKLYEIKQMSPMRIEKIDGFKYNATFHHIDGSYSYCTFDDEILIPGVGRQEIFHLAAWTEMVEVDGRWEIKDV